MKAPSILSLAVLLAIAACGAPPAADNASTAGTPTSPGNAAELDAALAEAGAMDAQADAAQNASVANAMSDNAY